MPFVQTAAHLCRPAMGLCLMSMPASWTHGHLHELWPRVSLLRLQHSELRPPHTKGSSCASESWPGAADGAEAGAIVDVMPWPFSQHPGTACCWCNHHAVQPKLQAACPSPHKLECPQIGETAM